MYQDYSGNYDTSSRGSSTSPAQPESFTSGSSTIGSPISTSSYQVTHEEDGLSCSVNGTCVEMDLRCVTILKYLALPHINFPLTVAVQVDRANDDCISDLIHHKQTRSVQKYFGHTI